MMESMYVLNRYGSGVSIRGLELTTYCGKIIAEMDGVQDYVLGFDMFYSLEDAENADMDRIMKYIIPGINGKIDALNNELEIANAMLDSYKQKYSIHTQGWANEEGGRHEKMG